MLKYTAFKLVLMNYTVPESLQKKNKVNIVNTITRQFSISKYVAKTIGLASRKALCFFFVFFFISCDETIRGQKE